MAEVKIEKGISIPTRWVAQETLSKMKAGDSVVINIQDQGIWRHASLQLRHKITTRKISKRQLRLWKLDYAKN